MKQTAPLFFLLLGLFAIQSCHSNSEQPPSSLDVSPKEGSSNPGSHNEDPHWVAEAPSKTKLARTTITSTPHPPTGTNQQCIGCHPAQFNSFKKSLHFESIKTHYETPVPDPLLPTVRRTKKIQKHGGYFAFETHQNKTYLIEFDQKNTEIARASVDLTIGNMGYFGVSYGTYDKIEDRYYRLPIGRFRDMPIISLSFSDKSTVHLRNKQPIMKSGSCTFCHGHVTTVGESTIANGLKCTTCHYNFQAHITEKTNSTKNEITSGPINPQKLSIVHQKNLCSACHSNALIEAQRENMAMQFNQDFLKDLGGRIVQADYDNNPHGSSANQIEATKCKINQKGLSCLSCHSIHQPNKTPTQSLNLCISCHETIHSEHQRPVVQSRCLECHMKKESMPYDQTEFFFEPAEIPKLLNHDIKVYPSATW